MPEAVCEHCGEAHPPATIYCPLTGGKLAAAAAQPPSDERPPTAGPRLAEEVGGLPVSAPAGLHEEQGVLDLLQQAFALYKQHARVLITVAAVIFVPGALAHACARAAILAPTIVVVHQGGQASAGAMAAGFTTMMLGLLALAVTGFLLHGVIIPLVQGALALAGADLLAGGAASWQEIWTLLFRRLATVLSAVIPAALLTGVGFFFLFVPGVLLAFFFSFVPTVALFEDIGGTAALRRSYELVRSDWLRMLLLLVVFGVISAVTSLLAGLLAHGLFGARLLQDALTLLVLPIPVIASVLLYFDIRRKREGFDRARLAEGMARLRQHT